MEKKTQNKKGFTLIELLVVISIIALLSSIILSSIQNARMSARDAKRISDLNQIKIALEMYRTDKGYYPPTPCGHDANCYSISSNHTWSSLQNELLPYIKTLPVDPINSACEPWGNKCYSYSYGNVGKTTYPSQYDLTAQLETSNHPLSCGKKKYKFYFNNSKDWCGTYPTQIYEASQ